MEEFGLPWDHVMEGTNSLVALFGVIFLEVRPLTLGLGSWRVTRAVGKFPWSGKID